MTECAWELFRIARKSGSWAAALQNKIATGRWPRLRQAKEQRDNPLLHKEKGGGLRRRLSGAAVEGERGVALAEDAGAFEAG